MGLFALASCSDFFEPEQDAVIDNDQHWNSRSELRRGALGAYAGLQDIAVPLVVLGDLRADLLEPARNAKLEHLEIHTHKISQGNKYIDPKPFYDIIANCNDVLHNVDKAMVDPDMTEEIRDAYKAEMITLRSWVYFQLSLIYKRVPVVTDVLNGKFPEYEPDVYGFEGMTNWLITEMEEAVKQDVPEWAKESLGGENSPWSKIHIDRRAFLGELHLTAGNYARAAELFKELIGEGGPSGTGLKLSENSGQEDWKAIWGEINSGASGLEHLSVIPFQKNNRQVNDFLKLFANDKPDRYLLKPTEVSVEKWELQTMRSDAKGDLFRGYGASYVRRDGELVVWKYLESKTEYENDAIHCIYRGADIHLFYAEAINRLGDHEEALAVINDQFSGESESAGIRGRVEVKAINLREFAGVADDPDQVIDEMAIMEQVILQERALELAFEGRRWNDLMRFANRSGRPEVLADRIAEKFGSEKESIRTLLMNKNNWKQNMPGVNL
ncbi:hypothetical protein FUAX_48190 (plasmid) [Fulvitalea axinellae]|uniref:RagB/SusD domain-containing protein n=2 Tax=Fulvitalea axinellae TaxID=1182444 RepID=A0AAU9CWX8_9BACT|nr:hypothetical protein FUAX_48190 [Fulvitalea axinellae]